MSLINDLSEDILASPAFKDRLVNLQIITGKKRLALEVDEFESKDIQRVLLQVSVLAMSDKDEHRKLAQKVNSLIKELVDEGTLSSFAIQLIAARLGNFPVLTSYSKVFAEDNFFQGISENNLLVQKIDLDPGLLGELYTDEEKARLEINSHILYFNTYQKEILTELTSKSLVSFSAPTSFGKSFVVRHHIGRLYATDQLGLSLILVPTKSLIDDYFYALEQMRKELDLDFAIHTHARNLEGIPDNSVFILTQERLSYLLIHAPDFVKKFALVYCDEAHNISRGYRGFVLRDVLRKLISLCGIKGVGNSETRYVFSSPLINNPDYFKDKLFPELQSGLTYFKDVKYTPVEKSIHLISVDDNSYKFSLLLENEEGKYSLDSAFDLFSKEWTQAIQALSGKAKQIAQDVSIVVSSDIAGGSILYTTGPLKAHEYGQALSRLLPTRDSESLKNRLGDIKKYIKDHYDESFGLTELLEKGIGLHYGPMPVGLRRAMVSLFEDGIIKYLICTPTLLEGVNLPAKNIYLFSDKYGGHSGKEKHTNLSFWNLVGRAGRMTYSLSGNIFCIERTVEKFRDLLEHKDSEITDPEKDVSENNTRKNYILQTLLEEDNFEYIKKARARSDIEYFIFELLVGEGSDDRLVYLGLDADEKLALDKKIEEIKNTLEIPINLVKQNPGIDPRLQDKLFHYIKKSETDDLLIYISIISKLYSLTGKRLQEIFRVTSDHIYWPGQRERDVERAANRMTQWIREFSLASFVQQVLKHLNGDGHNDDETLKLKKIDSGLRSIQYIETQMGFMAPKYLKCFFDILLLELDDRETQNLEEYRVKVDSFLFALETGITSSIGKHLFEKGVARPVAIKVNALVKDLQTEALADEFFQSTPVKDLLRSNLSRIAYKELYDHLS